MLHEMKMRQMPAFKERSRDFILLIIIPGCARLSSQVFRAKLGEYLKSYKRNFSQAFGALKGHNVSAVWKISLESNVTIVMTVVS